MPNNTRLRKAQVPKLDVKAKINSVNEENRTAEIIVSTGARGMRSNFFDSFHEELEISEDAIRMDRLNNGAPLLKDHFASIDNQVGIIERSWIEGANLMAEVRFSKDEADDKIFRKVQDGVIKNVSVGYRVFKYQEIEVGEDEIPVYRAIDWEPVEVSLVAIPFDSKSQVRNIDKNDCEIITRKKASEEKMKKEEVKAPEVNLDAVRSEGVEAEKTRVSSIFKLVNRAGLQADFAEQFISEGTELEVVRERVIDELAKKSSEVETRTQRAEVTVDETEVRHEAMVNAIASRANSNVELTEKGRMFRGHSLLDMAREFSGNQRGLDKGVVIERAFHTTSDFASILMDATNVSLKKEYAEQEQTFNPFTERVSLSDFKTKHLVSLGEGPQFKKTLEASEIKHGSMDQEAESMKLDSYTTGVNVTRQTIINDDLDAFGKVPRAIARSARRLESDLVFELITSNPTMGDGTALFHASKHSNLASSGAAISVASIGAGFTSMRKQKGIDGKTTLDLRPAILLTPVALDVVAMQFLSTNFLANAQSDVNPYAGKLAHVSDPRLDEASANAWYLIVGKSNSPLIELGTLDGQGPQINVKERFALGVSFEALHDVGAGLTGWREIYKNAGA
jgi:hypothetical protein